MIKKEQRLLAFDNIKRSFIKRFWLKRTLIKAFLNTFAVCVLFKQRSVFCLAKNNFKKAVISFSHNRCVMSGRSVAIRTKYKVSRFTLRLLLNDGLLTNLKRSAW